MRMFSAPLVLTALVALGGCQYKALEACDEKIKQDLRSPSSYTRISADSSDSEDVISVFIEYDAANAYGTLVRERVYCRIPKSVDGDPAYNAAYIM